ncbi:hypothetical protein [Rheinheimera hassiensis]|uniref:hypothetical protein n=1 Tax=Rheinheimera hassiensis TaxID=1193627 RepID=UPI001F051DAB|nr:hypothetical protein [Rheinheimera hassiensis]
MAVNIQHYDYSQLTFGDFKVTDTIEFMCVEEFRELLTLIATSIGYEITLRKAGKENFFIISNNGNAKIRLSSIEPGWDGDCGSDKFLLTALITKADNICYEWLNKLNVENTDIKFCVKSVMGSTNKYLVISELLNMTGGLTIKNLITRLQTLFINQRFCMEALSGKITQVGKEDVATH